jgi:hypothetical protein
MCPIQLFATIPHFSTFFSKQKKELLPVALFWQEKIGFKIPGFLLLSGALT